VNPEERWMLTSNATAFSIAHPRSEDVHLTDMAHQLATSNRFNGAAVRPYSIAEHSLLVVEIMERELGITDPSGLLAGHVHDGHEIYFGDLISPVKWELGLPATQLERRFERVVQMRYGLITASHIYRDQIKRADLMALATERRDLLPRHPRKWAVLEGIEPVAWVNLRDRDALDWRDWRQAFEDKFHELNYARVLRGHYAG
jgi:uncharacterized protein